MRKLKQLISNQRKKINSWLASVIVPGTQGMSLLRFVSYLKPVFQGNFNTRASGISFKLFLAIFPAIILFFTFIPYIPIKEFQKTLMVAIEEMLPENVFPLIEKTIFDIVNIKHSGLLSLGFILTLYFSSNGFISLISSFNQSINITETRTWYQKRLVSLLLVFITAAILIFAVIVMAIGHETLGWLEEKEIVKTESIYSLVFIGRWFVLGTMIYLTLAMVYYIAPANNTAFRFFSIGSLIASLLIILLAWGFGFFIKRFSSYNALYGSVSTILILMLYIYYNAIIMLTGFELNASIAAIRENSAPKRKKRR